MTFKIWWKKMWGIPLSAEEKAWAYPNPVLVAVPKTGGGGTGNASTAPSRSSTAVGAPSNSPGSTNTSPTGNASSGQSGIGLDVFHKALAYTFQNEGGFSDIKEDKGGATNFGIIREELARWRHHDVSASDVANMDRAEAEAIYKAWYWDALKLSQIEAEHVAMALFDRSVLNGLTGVSRHVRAVLGYSDTDDGDAANFDKHISEVNQTNPVAFVMRLADRCEAKHRERVAQDSSQKRFLLGWLNRVNRMRKELGDGTEKSVFV